MWPTVAYLLLTASFEGDVPQTLAPSESLRIALQTVAIELEIMDPREARWVLTRPEDFQADVRMLRRRYQELADAPLVVDAWRFPDRDTVNQCLAFNRAYRQNVEAQWAPAREWETGEALGEVDRLYRIWDSVRDAQGDYYYITARRAALKSLRDTIGAEAYARGDLPCHVPLHRFRVVD
jgi:hypothetical protein